MKKQKKKGLFQGLDLTQKQLVKRWIWIASGLILLFVILIILVVFIFKGDINLPGVPQFAKTNKIESSQGSLNSQKQMREYAKKYDNYDYEELYQLQISNPKVGEEIAIIHLQGTDKTIKIKFFEEDAPEIVRQFKRLAKDGFYNGAKFYSEKDESIKTIIADERVNWEPIGEPSNKEEEEKILNEIESWETLDVKSNKVLPYNGAVCANGILLRNKDYGVNFFVMNMDSNRVVNYTDLNVPTQLQNLFTKYGNGFNYILNFPCSSKKDYENPNANLLDYIKYPTFAQVVEGMDLVKDITKTSKELKIQKIEIIKYGE